MANNINTKDITLKLAEILVGISKDNRPEMAAHHSRLDEFKALLMEDNHLDAIFNDELLTAWNELMEMDDEAQAKLNLELNA